MRRLLLVAVLLVQSTLAHAVQPDEILDDPALEDRARAISKELRCPVCQNENIDESSAPVARDLRLLVRERLVAGDSDDEVMNFVMARFGEFVLLTPQATGANLVLWLSAPAMLVVALGIGIVYARRRSAATPVEALTDEEAARLKALLDKDVQS